MKAMYKIAQNVIEIFGGHQVLADALGLDISRIYRWTYPKEKGGTDGLIPANHQQTLLSKALELGISLSPADFFETPKPKKINKTRS